MTEQLLPSYENNFGRNIPGPGQLEACYLPSLVIFGLYLYLQRFRIVMMFKEPWEQSPACPRRWVGDWLGRALRAPSRLKAFLSSWIPPLERAGRWVWVFQR